MSSGGRVKNKWSKIIRPQDGELVIESFEMAELSPLGHGRKLIASGLGQEDEESDHSHDCSQLQQQAYENGREEGVREGKAQLQAEVEVEMKRALEMVEQVGVARLKAIRQAEVDIVELALAVAKKVIHREVSINKDIVVHQVNHALSGLSSNGMVEIRVHPDEVEYLKTSNPSVTNRDGSTFSPVITGNPNVTKGGCVVEADTVLLDATVDRQLEVISQELT